MVEIIDSIYRTLEAFFASLGYFGMGLGMFIESCCIPLPSEVILPIAGNLVAKFPQEYTMLWANVAVGVGSILGSLLAYYIGYFGGRPLVLKIINKFGKYVFITMEHFEKADNSFKKYGSATVFVGRLLPIIRTFISLPAGIAKMNVWKFILFSVLGMVPWNFMLIYLGFVFGEKYETVVKPWMHQFSYIVVAVCVLIFGFIVYKFVKYYKRMKKESKQVQE
ncbi:MAG: DedA family protein [Clostridia bacterium]